MAVLVGLIKLALGASTGLSGIFGGGFGNCRLYGRCRHLNYRQSVETRVACADTEYTVVSADNVLSFPTITTTHLITLGLGALTMVLIVLIRFRPKWPTRCSACSSPFRCFAFNLNARGVITPGELPACFAAIIQATVI